MKTINKILGLLLMTTMVLVGCSRDYDAPPLDTPEYDGPEANITISEIKKIYSKVLEDSKPQLIELDYVLKATVASSDNSGNVYKQMYIQDVTGGLNIQIDQNNISTVYAFGQEIYLDLHGLYVGEYNGVLQLAAAPTAEQPDRTTRISFEMFKKIAHRNGFALPKAVRVKETTIDQLNDDMISTLIQLNEVHFVDGGKLTYAETGNSAANATDRILKDKSGKTIVVRTSKYASFSGDKLPIGTGSVKATLGKFRDTWQLTISSTDDVFDFDGKPVGEDGSEEGGDKPAPEEDKNALFQETFSTGKIVYDKENRIKIGDYKDSSNKNVQFSDPSGKIDLRTHRDINYAWLPAGTDLELTVTGIDLSKAEGKSVTLSYKLMANVYNAGDKANVSDVEVLYDGAALNVPNVELIAPQDKDKAYEVVIKGLTPSATTKLVFVSKADKNKLGFRLTDIKFTVGDGGSVTPPVTPPTDPTEPTDPVEPVEGVLYAETFATGRADFPSKQRPKIAAFTDYDNKTVTYSDPSGLIDLRSFNKVNYAWLAAGKESELVISGLNLSKGKNLVLTYALMPNLYEAGSTANLADIEVYCNGTKLIVPSQSVANPADKDVAKTITIENIPAEDNVTLTFKSTAALNKVGFRLGNIQIANKK